MVSKRKCIISIFLFLLIMMSLILISSLAHGIFAGALEDDEIYDESYYEEVYDNYEDAPYDEETYGKPYDDSMDQYYDKEINTSKNANDMSPDEYGEPGIYLSRPRIALFSVGGPSASRVRVSPNYNKQGIIDQPGVNCIIDTSKLNLYNASVITQQLIGTSWFSGGMHFSCQNGSIYYNGYIGGADAPYYVGDERVIIQFNDAVICSDGSRKPLEMVLHDFEFGRTDTTASSGTAEVLTYSNTENILQMSTSVGRCAIFMCDIRVIGARPTDRLYLHFYDLDQPGLYNDPSTGSNYNYNATRYMESIMVKSGIYPDTQPTVPADSCLYVTDHGDPANGLAFYASRPTNNNGIDEYMSGFSYTADALNGTSFRWMGMNGCTTRFGMSSNEFQSFVVNTKVRTELESSSPTGGRTYTGYSTVNSIWYPTFISPCSYSFTYTNSALMSSQGLNAYADNWIFNYSGQTVGSSNLTFGTTYYITIDRNRYTYSFNPNPPNGKSAADVKNMPANKTVTASKAISGMSDATVSEPSLQGYWFLGWSESPQGTGVRYPNRETGYSGSETMKSNKTFYAIWQPATYTVHFNPNGSSNPDNQTGEVTQNTTTGAMSDQVLYFDQWKNLNTNNFKREGYTFAGWNTKADGTGTAYTDKQSVMNMIPYTANPLEITLYAQWKKKLGTETITVISEETGNPVSNVNMKLQKSVNGKWTDVSTGTTNENGQISVNNLHWFNYRWVITNVPAGYMKSPDTAFTITYNQLSAKNQVILYMKHVSIILDSQVSDIIIGESSPAFIYHIRGTDVAGVVHEYNLLVQTNVYSRFGTNRIPDLFAGVYTIIQTPVSRYNPLTAVNVNNAVADGINATVDVKNNNSAEVKFPYTIKEYGWYYGIDSQINSLTK